MIAEKHLPNTRRLRPLYALCGILLLILATTLGYRQLLQKDEFKERERKQAHRRILRPGPRGNVLDREGRLAGDHIPAMDLTAKVTVLSEGTRGPLTQAYLEWQKIGAENPQIFALGVKELWETKVPLARVIHTMGWPLPNDTFGGSFLYPLEENLIALGLVLIYITFRFQWRQGISAIVALLHDVLVVVGMFSIFDKEFTLPVVAALLTVVGYSLNDTIVVFDRIRESLRLKRGDVEDVMNLAINATLSRTVLTSVTTFVAVFVLYIYGGPALKAFSFAIMIGVVVGTYSSIFVASPIVLIWSRMRGSNLRRELLDANLEAQVNPATGVVPLDPNEGDEGDEGEAQTIEEPSVPAQPARPDVERKEEARHRHDHLLQVTIEVDLLSPGDVLVTADGLDEEQTDREDHQRDGEDVPVELTPAR